MPLRHGLGRFAGDLQQQRADEVREHGRRGRAALAHVAARDLERHAVRRARPRPPPRPTRARCRTPAPAPSRASRPRSRARRSRSPSPRAGRPASARPAAPASAASSRASRSRTPARARSRRPARRRAPAPTAAAPAAAPRRSARGTSASRPRATSLVDTSTSASPATAAHVADLRQLARARRRARTRRRRRQLDLLEPAGREGHQVGEHELRVLALARGPRAGSRASPGRTAAQPSSTRRSRSTKPSGAEHGDAGRRRTPRETPGGDQRDRLPSGGAMLAMPRDQRRREVRDHRRAPTAGPPVTSATCASTPFARAVATAPGRARSPSPARSPRCAAATASTPQPQPQSTSAVGGSSCSSARHSLVVGCAASPNVSPGSTTRPSPGQPRRADRHRADRHRLQVLVPGGLPALVDRRARDRDELRERRGSAASSP